MNNRNVSLVYNDVVPVAPNRLGELDIYKGQQRAIQAQQEGRTKLFEEVVTGVLKDQLQEVGNQANLGLLDAYETHKANPTEFKKAAESVRKGMIKGGRFSLSQEESFNASFDQEFQKYNLQVHKNLSAVENDKLKEDALVAQNIDSSKASMAVDKLFDPNLNIDGQLELEDATNKFINSLEKTDNGGMPLFTAQQRFSALDDFQGNVFSKFASMKMAQLPTIEQKQAFLQEIERGNENLTLRLADGKIMKLDASTLSNGQMNAIRSQLNKEFKAYEEQQEVIRQTTMVESVMKGKTFANPKNKEYKGAVDIYFNNQIVPITQIDAGDPNARANYANTVAEFVNSVNTIPNQLVDNISAMSNSNDPNHMALGADIIKSIKVNSPDLLSQIPHDAYEKSQSLLAKTNAGIPLDLAFKQVEQQFNINPDIYNTRKNQFSRVASQNKLSFDIDKLRKTYGFLWFFRPDTPPSPQRTAFADQFYQLTQDAYARGNELKDAYDSALKQLSAVWGKTEINGDAMLTMYPPEKYYMDEKNGLNPVTLKRLAIEYAMAETGISELGANQKEAVGGNQGIGVIKLKKSKLYIIGDNITSAEAGDETSAPTYQLWYENDSGMLDMLYSKSGKPLRVGANIWRK
jgi:hypothetical protein